MSQLLSLELSDQVFAAILRQAETIGISPEHLAATLIEQKVTQGFKSLPTDVEKEAARAKFERHFGTIGPIATNVENESIDADLAAEYASSHEEN